MFRVMQEQVFFFFIDHFVLTECRFVLHPGRKICKNKLLIGISVVRFRRNRIGIHKLLVVALSIVTNGAPTNTYLRSISLWCCTLLKGPFLTVIGCPIKSNYTPPTKALNI